MAVWLTGVAMVAVGCGGGGAGRPVRRAASRPASGPASRPAQPEPLPGELVSRLSQVDQRAAAIDELAAGGRKDIARFVVPFLADKDPAVRLAAARALRRSPDANATMALAARLTGERIETIREEVCAALELMDHPTAHATLGLAWRDRNDAVRLAAARAAGKLKGSEWLGRLMDLLSDSDPRIRAAAVEGIAVRKDDEAIRGLLSKMGDPNDAIADRATGYVRALGRPFTRLYAGAPCTWPGRVRMLKLLGEMADPNLVPTILAVTASGHERSVPPERRQAAVEALASVGERAVVPLDLAAVRAPEHMGWKQVAADVFVRLKSQAGVAAILERAMRWRVPPDEAELALWLDTLNKIGSPSAKEAATKVQSHVEQRRAWAKLLRVKPPLGDHATAPGLAGVTGDRDVVATLKGALLGADVHVTFECRGGNWPRTAWGYGCNYDKADHEVTVRKVAPRADGVDMDLLIDVTGDPWTYGGPAPMEVHLRKAGDGWAGTYGGAFRGKPCGSDVAVAIVEPVPVFPHEPLKPGEHPRLVERQLNWQPPKEVVVTEEGNQAMHRATYPPLPWIAAASGGPIVEAALLYDRYYYQADPERRRQAAASLIKNAKNLYYGGGGMAAPWHNWQAQWRCGTAAAALAVLGDPTDYPPEPKAEAVAEIAPAADYQPPPGVPTVELNGSPVAVRAEVSLKWLLAGPLPLKDDTDYLAALGGPDKCRPRVGTRLGAGEEGAFRAMDWSGASGTLRSVNLDEMLKGRRGQVLYLYAVADSLFAHAVRARFSGRMWLAGQPVQSEQPIAVGVGKYPVLAEVKVSPDLPAFMSASMDLPQLIEIPDPREVHRKWEEGKRQWEANGQASPEVPRLLKLAELNARRYIRWALGDAGFNCEKETYTAASMGSFSVFFHAYFDCFGRNIIWGSRAEGVPLRHKAGTLDGRAVIGPFYSGESFRELAQPAILKALEARTPAEFPNRCIRDKRYASYIFRNGWKDADDIIAIIEGKGEHLRAAHSHYQIGTFRLYGLGSAWAIHSSHERDAPHEHHNVLLLPEDAANMTLGAKEAHFQVADDGSGAVTLDMNDPYMAFDKGAPVDWEGKVRHDRLRDLGIRGLRAFAVDFSGRCGAPGLFVVADHVTGGGRKEWIMHPAAGGGKSEAGTVSTEVSGNTFLLRSPNGATLKGTFVSPAGVKLAVETRMEPYPRPGDTKIGKNGKPEGPVRKPTKVLVAAGPDGKAGDFFVIMTLQKGAPPAVKVQGAGLDAVATVGGQTARFDGQKVVLSATRSQP